MSFNDHDYNFTFLLQPMIELAKEFMMCPHPLFLEASLDKEVCIIKSNHSFFADIKSATFKYLTQTLTVRFGIFKLKHWIVKQTRFRFFSWKPKWLNKYGSKFDAYVLFYCQITFLSIIFKPSI